MVVQWRPHERQASPTPDIEERSKKRYMMNGASGNLRSSEVDTNLLPDNLVLDFFYLWQKV